jgi:hypothetical protein
MTAFWEIIQFNWTRDERASLRAICETWMAADKSKA